MSNGRAQRDNALAIWTAAVQAALPEPLVVRALQDPVLNQAIRAAPRVLVVGGGKAGPGMAAGVETALAGQLERVEGLVAVPEGLDRPLKRLRLRFPRKSSTNASKGWKRHREKDNGRRTGSIPMV